MGEESIFIVIGVVLGIFTLIIVCCICYRCKNKKGEARVVQIFGTTSFGDLLKTFRSRYTYVTFIACSKRDIVLDIPLVVVCLSTSRVEDECRSALEGLSCQYTPSTTLLVVLHRLSESDISDVISFYTFVGVAETVHVGFTEKETKFSKSTDQRIKTFFKNVTL